MVGGWDDGEEEGGYRYLHIYEGLASRDAKISLEWMTPPSSSLP